MEYLLASTSPRRKELMKMISDSFDIQSEEIDEHISYKLGPVEAVKDISFRKGDKISQLNPNKIVIAADTIVVIDNEIIGKPIDEIDAYKILKRLSARTHQVITGYTIFYQNKHLTNISISEVTFNELSDALIKDYISSKSPLDKAGAYGLQDNENYHLIKKIKGSYYNVIGFPVDEIKVDIDRLIK